MSTPNSQTSRTPRCPNHPPMSATLRCDSCHMFLCRLCVVKDGGRFFCSKCGKLCRVPSPEELGAALQRQTVIYHAASPHQPVSAPQSVFGSQPLSAVAEGPVAPESSVPAPVTTLPEVQLLADEGQPESPKPPIPFIERKPPYFCRNHPMVKATRICQPCKECFCNACAKMAADNPICPDCSAQLRMLSREEQGLPPQPFADRVIEALAYPFRGAGKLMLLMGAIFLWILSYAWLPGVILASGFMYTYFAKVCRASASGRESPPDWPDLHDIGNALYFLAAKALSLAPALLYLILVVGIGAFAGLHGQADEEAVPEDQEEVRYKELAEDKNASEADRNFAKQMVEARHPPKHVGGINPLALLAHIGVAGVLYALGSFYLPMALLALLLYRNTEVLNPAFVLSSIMKVRRDYLLAYLVLIITDVVGFIAGLYGNAIFLIGPLIGEALWLYLMMSQMYVLGRLYHLNERRLNWFG